MYINAILAYILIIYEGAICSHDCQWLFL